MKWSMEYSYLKIDYILTCQAAKSSNYSLHSKGEQYTFLRFVCVLATYETDLLYHENDETIVLILKVGKHKIHRY